MEDGGELVLLFGLFDGLLSLHLLNDGFLSLLKSWSSLRLDLLKLLLFHFLYFLFECRHYVSYHDDLDLIVFGFIQSFSVHRDNQLDLELNT